MKKIKLDEKNFEKILRKKFKDIRLSKEKLVIKYWAREDIFYLEEFDIDSFFDIL